MLHKICKLGSPGIIKWHNNEVLIRNNGKITSETVHQSSACIEKLCKNVIVIESGLPCQKLWGMLALADVFIEHTCCLQFQHVVSQGRIGTYNFVVPGLSEPLF